MSEPFKSQPRKRVVVGWRQFERRRMEVRAKQRTPPIPSKPPG